MRLTKNQKRFAMCAWRPCVTPSRVVYADLVQQFRGVWRDREGVVYDGPLYPTSADAVRAARIKGDIK